jgi:antitoxin (DNA-binding transcriptional repressor) of toxin-antitoxin stability system
MYISDEYKELHMKINAKEARNKLSSLLNQIEEGKEVARLVPPKGGVRVLSKLKDFRSSIRLSGKPLSTVVIRKRREERY